MKKKLIAVLGLAAAVSMLAGCSAKTISKNPETLLKNARKSLEYVDADASLKVTGKHTGFMRQEADLTYNAEEQYQEVGEVSLLSGTVQMTDGDDSYTDSIQSYVESKNDGSTSYFNFKGAWEYAKTPKLSEMNYLTALLTPENFENLTVSQMRDEGEISVAGPMQGDKLFDAMKTSVSLSDFFVRSSDFRDALRGSEYMVSVYLDSKTGEYHALTGNMSGCLIGYYILSQKQAVDGKLPEDGAFIRSIVTTNMADAIAEHFGVKLIEVLTGFKWIGQKILDFEKTGKGTYLFGMEESYGCLPGTYARDKDAVAACVVLCEAAAYYKTRNMTLWDAMLEMYETFGYYRDEVSSVTLAGKEGIEKIGTIMTELRENAPEKIGPYTVEKIRDYDKETILDLATGSTTETGLPKSNVLYYELTDGAWLCVRPSGTEPKIKFYFGIRGTSMEDAIRREDEMKAALDALVKPLI